MITSPTLPATIPGLLLRGSPVIVTAGALLDHRGLFVGVRADGSVDVALDHYRGPEVKGGADDSMALDLSDPTGRAHAAWWLIDQLPWGELESAVKHVTGCGDLGAWLDRYTHPEATITNERIEELRLVCLHVAGVAS